jgi:molecular chaperone GrpE
LSQDPGDEPESPAEAARAATAEAPAASDAREPTAEAPATSDARDVAAEAPATSDAKEPTAEAPAIAEAATAEAPAAAPDAAGSEAPRPAEPEADPNTQLRQRAKLAEHRLGEVLTAYRQAKLDNEGFRDRVTRDVQRHWERHNQKLVLRFIEVLDNLDRALESAEQTYAGNPLIEGLILVRSQLLQILQKEGLERIPVLGLPFDPAFAEAVGIQPVTDPDHDHVVVKDLVRGYRLHGRLARASRVLVGVYHEAASATPSPQGADEPQAAASSQDFDPAAKTIRLDEKTLREIFGDRKEPESD